MKDYGLIDIFELDNYTEEQRAFLPPYKIGYVWLSNLNTTQKFQRPLEVARVNKIAENFDSEQINLVTINIRENGEIHVTDGQHTVAAISKLANGVDRLVLVAAHFEKSYEEEALLFANSSEYTRKLLPMDRFIGRLEGGCKEESLVAGIVYSHGFHIARSTNEAQKKGIQAVDSLMQINRKYGAEILDRTLDIVVKTWDYHKKSLSGKFLKSIALVINTYDDLDEEKAIKQWGRCSCESLIRTARDMQQRKNDLARALVLEYNARCRTNLLDERKLF